MTRNPYTEDDRPVKIWQGMTFMVPAWGQHDFVIATPHKTKVAKAIDSSVLYVSNYCSETYNDESCAVAMTQPGRLFVRPDRGKRRELGVYAGWHLWDPDTRVATPVEGPPFT